MNDHYEDQKDEHLKLMEDYIKREEKEMKQSMGKIEKNDESVQDEISERRATLAARRLDLEDQARLRRYITQTRERTEVSKYVHLFIKLIPRACVPPGLGFSWSTSIDIFYERH
jgi:hypothetical protein